MMASSSRARSSSPFSYRKPASPYSSSNSSTSSHPSNRIIPRSGSVSSASYMNSFGSGYGSRSTTPNRSRSEVGYNVCNRSRTPVAFNAVDLIAAEPTEEPRNGDSISVTIRFRPLSDREFQKGDEIAWYGDGDKIVRNEYNAATAYAFDKVFGEQTTTQDVYDIAAKPVVKASMEGVNGTVFAYGVTSSGKTFTMHGDQHSPGVIPLAIKDVFSIIQDSPGREFLLRVSYLEIYNEVINDLLDPTGQNLRIREDAQGTYVEGIKEEVVLSPGHALSFIAAGEEHRHVGSNNFNLLSSRSHTIFTLMIESSARGDDYDGVIFSQLNLIDLAGSESSKTETTGLRRKEGSYINKSLLTLGTVIGKLSEGRSSHVPYRDSKLTRLLQSSLSGHGHVSLICTVTPASSNLEETHNTLKFASRAKRVEIFASRNKIIDEKSLIKKYQKEISTLKEELDHLRRGMLGVNHEEILTLRQKLEEGQVKMQSRLEEEEEAKAALMSRIQRLTKLILVSTKSTIPGLTEVTSVPVVEQSEISNPKAALMQENENTDNSPSTSITTSDASSSVSHKRSGNWNDELLDLAPKSSDGIDFSSMSKLPTGGMSQDQVDLLIEQVKMLAEEVALSTSTLKRFVEQSINDPESSKCQIQVLEREIQEKKRKMRALEQRLVENGETSVSNTSLVDMQQTVMRLMTQCNEKAFELEIKSADNRILQEQLQNKCSENLDLMEKVKQLELQLTSLSGVVPSVPVNVIDELKAKIQSQELHYERMKIEQVQLSEENSGLRVQNQKLAEEASYAKELASAAAVELKNLAGEITRLSMQNNKLEKELANRESSVHARANVMTSNGLSRKYNDGARTGRKGRYGGRNSEIGGMYSGDFESWDLDHDDLKMELIARRQREAALEAALAEKDSIENEYRKKAEDAKKKEEALENDLANMWVLVAKLKKDSGIPTDSNPTKFNTDAMDSLQGQKNNDFPESISDLSKPTDDAPKNDTLVVRLKARMQEIKEKENKYLGNGDSNSHVCKVCFESPTAAILLPCRHFCMCKSCSLACSECPICRTKIVDRLFAFAS